MVNCCVRVRVALIPLVLVSWGILLAASARPESPVSPRESPAQSRNYFAALIPLTELLSD